jgi:hypothetical protein
LPALLLTSCCVWLFIAYLTTLSVHQTKCRLMIRMWMNNAMKWIWQETVFALVACYRGVFVEEWWKARKTFVRGASIRAEMWMLGVCNIMQELHFNSVCSCVIHNSCISRICKILITINARRYILINFVLTITSYMLRLNMWSSPGR